MTLIIKINSLVVVFIIFVKTNLCQAECNLSKIFRTPRDFDHLEIVERVGFDRSEPSTTPSSISTPSSKSIKKNGNNYANAQVTVRFGTDYGSNHIMKVPPQCRNLIGNGMTHLPDAMPSSNFFYPPPPHRIPHPCPPPQYYHPYPPPVPYVFPNYYFWGPREESAYLPPQLNEYFRRHPEFVVTKYPLDEDVFVGGRPVRREEVGKMVIPKEFVDAQKTLLKVTEDRTMPPNNLPVGLRPVGVIDSRILRPFNPTNQTNDEINQEINRKCTIQQKENDDDFGNDICMEFSDSFDHSQYQRLDQQESEDKIEPKCPEPTTPNVQKPKELKITEPRVQYLQKQTDHLGELNISKPNAREFNKDLESLLLESLVKYNCKNCTGPPKMLVSYPIINKDDLSAKGIKPIEVNSCSCCATSKQGTFFNDIDSLGSLKTDDIIDDGTYNNCQTSNNTTNKSTGKSFTKDIDDLVSIFIEIVDPGRNLPEIPKSNCPDVTSLFPELLPPIAKSYFPDNLLPDVISTLNPILSKVRPSPLSAIFNLLLSKNDVSNLNEKDSQNASSQCICNSPEITQPQSSSSSGQLDKPDPKITLYHISTAEHTDIIQPTLQLSNSNLPEANVLLKQDVILPKYIKVIPRADLELVDPEHNVFPSVILYSSIPLEAPREPEASYCGKCGHNHSGGTYCDKCGYPVIFYPGPLDTCPSCPRETRQLNDL